MFLVRFPQHAALYAGTPVWDGIFTDDLTGSVVLSTSVPTRCAFQRGRSTISFSGTYSVSGGEPAGMAWRVGSGDWKQFTAETIGSGSWAGTLAIPADYAAQGTLEIKPINGDSVTPATRSNITVSDVWVINSQSNGDGRATNAQTYTKTNFDWIYTESADTFTATGTGSPAGATGESFLPHLATLIDASGIPPVLVTGARIGGTSFGDNDWNPPSDGAYLTSIGNMEDLAAASGGFAGEIWIVGESDAVLGTATQDYIDAWIARRDATDTAIPRFVSAPSYISQIGEVATATTGLDTIREALKLLGSGSEDARATWGPNILTEQYGDGTHYGTEGGNIDTTEANAQLERIAAMWFRSLYGATKTAPEITGYTVGTGADAAKVTVTFDRAMENHTRSAEWTVIDDEGTLTVSSTAQGGTTAQVIITCNRALYGDVTVSFGEGTSAEVAIEDVAAQLREATAVNGVKYPPQYSYREAAGTGVGALPVNTVAPTLGGAAAVGGTITATDGTYTGVPTPTVGSYQWQTSDDGSTGWTDISGATSATYLIDVAYAAKYLRRGEVATNAVGSASRVYTAASSQITSILSPLDIFGSALKLWTTTADASTLFQEISSESTAADAATEPIGTWRDKSGNSNHLRATGTGTRPLYEVDGAVVYAAFDATDDRMLIPFSMASKRYLVGIAYKPAAVNWVFVGRASVNSGWAGIGQSGSASTTLSSLSVLNGLYYDGTILSGANRGGHYTESQASTRMIMDMTAHSTLTDPAIGKAEVGAYYSPGDLAAVVVVELSGAPDSGDLADLDAYLASVVGT